MLLRLRWQGRLGTCRNIYKKGDKSSLTFSIFIRYIQIMGIP